MKFLRLVVLIAPLLLTACGLSSQQKADYADVRSSGVSPVVYDKMLHGDDLSLSDIKTLTRARVREDIILRYLRDRGTVYFLDTNDVESLRKAKVSQSIIDYMLQTPQLYQPALYPTIGIGVGLGYDPLWYGPRPYPYGYPYHHWH